MRDSQSKAVRDGESETVQLLSLQLGESGVPQPRGDSRSIATSAA